MKSFADEQRVLWRERLDRFGVTMQSYLHLVKTKCAGCGCFIEFDVDRYEDRGNFCTGCNRRVLFAALYQ